MGLAYSRDVHYRRSRRLSERLSRKGFEPLVEGQDGLPFADLTCAIPGCRDLADPGSLNCSKHREDGLILARRALARWSQ